MNDITEHQDLGFWTLFFTKSNQGFLEKLTVLGQGYGKYKLNLGYLVEEIKKVFKDKQDILKDIVAGFSGTTIGIEHHHNNN